MSPDQHESLIYHIAEQQNWREALETGEYRASSLEDEGFIHCSQREQVLATAERYYHGRVGLVLLEIRADPTAVEVRYEASAQGELFPHLYGPLPVQLVERVLVFEPQTDGTFTWPEDAGRAQT